MRVLLSRPSRLEAPSSLPESHILFCISVRLVLSLSLINYAEAESKYISGIRSHNEKPISLTVNWSLDLCTTPILSCPPSGPALLPLNSRLLELPLLIVQEEFRKACCTFSVV